MSKELDPLSKEFIAWASEKMQDELWFWEFRKECANKLKNFYSRNPKELRQTVEAKLVRGGLEHGAPNKYTEEQINQELELEYTDVLGWSLIIEWYRDRKIQPGEFSK